MGEAGEVAEKIKKIARGDPHPPSNLDIVTELGDVLWYLVQLARSLGYELGSVAYINQQKCMLRRERGTLKGNGDDR